MQPVIRFRRYSNENVSRAVALLSPYLFWIVIGIAGAGIWLIAA
jgi:hypothetical protein